MMKSYLPVLIFLFAVQFASAQRNDLVLKSSDKGLFVDHKVAAKENFFAIGRLYNVNPKSVATFNKLDINKGLVIGQLLRIPLTDTNFTQIGNTGTPVYYKVGDNENLSKVSSLNRNVSIDNLRSWNSMSGDNVKPGTKLIVGFLQSKELPSVTLSNKPKQEVITPIDEKTVGSGEVEKLVETKPPPPEELKPVVKEEPKKAEPVFAKQDEKPTAQGDGYFKHHFEQQARKAPVSKEITATSGIFKTTSGWLDSKYYMLMDRVQPGTIIKITNPTNNKVIYAKVLGEMAGIRQNEGYDVRISSAAASALQISEQDKFIVKVNY